jgi:hypothetical protein
MRRHQASFGRLLSTRCHDPTRHSGCCLLSRVRTRFPSRCSCTIPRTLKPTSLACDTSCISKRLHEVCLRQLDDPRLSSLAPNACMRLRMKVHCRHGLLRKTRLYCDLQHEWTLQSPSQGFSSASVATRCILRSPHCITDQVFTFSALAIKCSPNRWRQLISR